MQRIVKMGVGAEQKIKLQPYMVFLESELQILQALTLKALRKLLTQ